MNVDLTTIGHVKDPYDVYIGRDAPGKFGSVFANPFHIGKDGTRAEVIERYATYLNARLAQEPALVLELASLKGRRLGCWCKPAACHGDVLRLLLDGPDAPPPQLDLF